MLNWWEALILGSVQGFTEFLPVSSTGHLVFVQLLLGVEAIGQDFDIFVHIGTLLAVFVFFGRNLIPLTRKYWWQVGVATVPAVIFALLFKDWVEAIRLDIGVMILSYLFNAVLLAIASLLLPTTEQGSRSPRFQALRAVWEKAQRSLGLTPRDSISTGQAFLVGIFQALAIIPAVSRSASTVAAGVVVGLTRENAFTFAFLISIPAVLGAIVFSLFDVWQSGLASSIDWSVYLLAVFMSAITGYFALMLLRWIITKGQLWFFAGYCVLVSVLLFFFA